MLPFPLKLILSLATLTLLLVVAAFVQSGRAEPALTRSNSELSPPRTPVLCRRRLRRPSLYPLELRRLATLTRCR